MARVVQPPKIHANFTKGNLFEYKTRHLIDGRIVDCDTRISLVAGYMPGEVKDLSPFSFMHEDDVRWVIVALRQSKYIFFLVYCFFFSMWRRFLDCCY